MGQWPLLRNRDFMLLWSGEVLSELGSQTSTVAYPLLILALTGSAAKAGVVGLAKWLPLTLFALPAGVLADRVDRKRLMIGCDAVRMLGAASIVAALWLGRPAYLQVVAVAFLDGALFITSHICERGALRQVVAPEQLQDAVAQNEARYFSASIVGPPLGGVLFAAARSLPFVADTASFLSSMTAISFTRANRGQAFLAGALGRGGRRLLLAATPTVLSDRLTAVRRREPSLYRALPARDPAGQASRSLLCSGRCDVRDRGRRRTSRSAAGRAASAKGDRACTDRGRGLAAGRVGADAARRSQRAAHRTARGGGRVRHAGHQLGRCRFPCRCHPGPSSRSRSGSLHHARDVTWLARPAGGRGCLSTNRANHHRSDRGSLGTRARCRATLAPALRNAPAAVPTAANPSHPDHESTDGQTDGQLPAQPARGDSAGRTAG